MFVVSKTLVDARSFLILVSWSLLAGLSDISAASDRLSSKVAVCTQVSLLPTNLGMTYKNVFSLNGFW